MCIFVVVLLTTRCYYILCILVNVGDGVKIVENSNAIRHAFA